MTARRVAAQTREALDRRLIPMGPTSRYAPPRLGWIRAVRDALGMSAANLAIRMGVSGASVRSLEENEMAGGIRLSSLQRAATAMDCALVYAFIPNESLQETVRRQAQWVLQQQIRRVNQTMALEAQEAETLQTSREAQLQQIVGSRQLWSRSGEL
jgi:predicted DNA-binding mobile mystery protein A